MMKTIKDWMTTERLLLRPWTESDAEAMYELAKDPHVGPVAGWPPHTGIDDSLNIIRERLAREGVFAIFLKNSNALIGCVGFVPHSADCDETEIEIGYWLGFPFWHCGYMHEALECVLEYVYQDLKYETVWCSYYDGNIRSNKCMKRCGFIYHHTEFDVPCELMGDKRTLHCMRMTKSEWETHRLSVNPRD